MSALIVTATLLTYAAMTLLIARWRYAATRPYTEPLACTYSHHTSPRFHIDSCYSRNPDSLITTTGEAVTFALLLGLAWPLIAPALLVRRVVTAGSRQLPEELAAEIRRLEAENDKLKRQQEGWTP